LLSTDAPVLRQPSPEPDPLREYHDIVARLDKTATTMIGTTTRQQVQLNQETLFPGLVKAGMAALGAVSPLIAGLRGLLGVQAEINLPELFREEKNQTTRDVIESVEQARQIFRDIFTKAEAAKVRLCVFIDDLDRCLPDVALDILEATNVFFFACELYQSFVDGYPLESAVVEARKALSVEHWDWSVYSLMANTARLDHLRLLSPLSRSDPVV
jgi:hypothetical protein